MHATLLSPPPLIDLVWHQHILDVADYVDACHAFCGGVYFLLFFFEELCAFTVRSREVKKLCSPSRILRDQFAAAVASADHNSTYLMWRTAMEHIAHT